MVVAEGFESTISGDDTGGRKMPSKLNSIVFFRSIPSTGKRDEDLLQLVFCHFKFWNDIQRIPNKNTNLMLTLNQISQGEIAWLIKNRFWGMAGGTSEKMNRKVERWRTASSSLRTATF